MKLPLVLCAIACGLLSAAAHGKNLFANASFASDGVGGICNWNNYADSPQTSITRLPGEGKDGACAVRIRSSRQNYFRQKDMCLVAGAEYRFGVWVRTGKLGSDHTFELLGWNKGWTRQFGHVRFPEDTNGEWRKVEWTGKMVPSSDSTYVMSVAGKSSNSEGFVDICSPYLEAIDEKVAGMSKPPDAEKPFRPRIVPIDRLLLRIPFSKPEITFYYPGDLDGGANRHELCGRLDGNEIPSVKLGIDRKALLKLGKPQIGPHELFVGIREVNTGKVVASNTYSIRVGHYWLSPPRGKILNNFVEEITNAPLANADYRFMLPVPTWVWISLDKGLPGTEVTLDAYGVPVIRHRPGEPFETMRYLSQGNHVLHVSGVPDGGTIRLHAVKRIVHCAPNGLSTPPTPIAANFTLYSKRYTGFYNTAAAYTIQRKTSGIGEWELLGPWLMERGISLQGVVKLAPWAEERTDAARSLAFLRGTSPYKCGYDILVDETSIASTRQSRNSFSEAVWQTIADGDGQAVNVFNNDAVDHIFADPASQASELASIVNSGNGNGMLYPEVYPAALKDEKAACHWEEHFLDYVKSIEKMVPVASDRILWYFGTFLSIGRWTDWPCPEADIRVLYAHFIHRLATDSAYAPYIGGISVGHFASSNEDVGRFLIKAVRHYCIEGRTDYLPARYGFEYLPGFVKNADFDEGFTNWTVRAAEDGKVEWKKIKNFGRDGQCRKKAPAGTGDSIVVFTRGAKGGNSVSQKVSGLEVGKVYSLAFATVDMDDYLKPHSVGKAFGCRATVEGGKMIPELAFERVTLGVKKGGEKDARHTTKRIVFRAERPDVTIVLSDWAEDSKPGAPIGRRTLLNYIRLQKYFYEDEADLADLVKTYGRPTKIASGPHGLAKPGRGGHL